MNRACKPTVLIFLLGGALGYAGAYAEYRDERDHRGAYSQYRHEWLALTALPGMLLSQAFRTYDCRLTEEWLVDKHRIAVSNAIFYAAVGGISFAARSMIRRILGRRTAG